VIKEWNYLRVIACLSIILLHCTTQIEKFDGFPANQFYRIIQELLCFATPSFILLSEIILANKYSDSLPQNFWKNRLKWIFTPFLFFGVIDYAIRANFQFDLSSIPSILYKWSGRYEGWFILVIMQFYILHYLVIKYKFKLRYFLPISLLIMLIHLSLLNSEISFFKQNIHHLKIPFTAWLGYFAIALYIGRYYSAFVMKATNYKWYFLVGLFLSVLLIYVNFDPDVIKANSRRLDIFPLTLMVVINVIIWAQNAPKIKLINIISNYAFGIYLVHWQVQYYITPYLVNNIDNPIIKIIALFFATLILTITIINLLSKFSVSQFIIGKIRNNN